MTRAELVRRYAQATGHDVNNNMVFYRVLALFKVSVIIQQIYYRYHHGLTKDARFASLPEVVKVALRAALRSADESSL